MTQTRKLHWKSALQKNHYLIYKLDATLIGYALPWKCRLSKLLIESIFSFETV